MSADEREEIKQNLFETVLPMTQISPADANPLLDEQRDFIASIRTGRAPRVTGEQACAALATAERVLAGIADHRWDGVVAGRIGPHFKVTPHVLAGPHWDRSSTPATAPHRKAG